MYVVCLKYVCSLYVVCLKYVCSMYVVCLKYVCRMYVVCLKYVCRMYVSMLVRSTFRNRLASGKNKQVHQNQCFFEISKNVGTCQIFKQIPCPVGHLKIIDHGFEHSVRQVEHKPRSGQSLINIRFFRCPFFEKYMPNVTVAFWAKTFAHSAGCGKCFAPTGTSEIVFGVLRCTRGRPSEIVRKRSPPESPNTVRARGTDCLRNLWVPQEGAGRPQRNAHVGVCENNTFADVSSPAFLVADTQRKQ